VPLGQGAVDSHVANPNDGMEAKAPVSMVSTAASIEDLVAAVIMPSLGTSPDLGREKNRIPGIVASLHDCMALLPNCLANNTVPVGPLSALEKQAHSDSEKAGASPSMASPTLEPFLNVGTTSLQKSLSPIPVNSEPFSRQEWEAKSDPIPRQEIVETLRIESEPPQLQQDLPPASPMAEHQFPPHQQSSSSSPMLEFLNQTSLECTSGPRLLVFSRQHQRRRGVATGGSATPLKVSTAAVGVVDPAPLETPHTAASSEVPDPSMVTTPLQASEIAGMAVPQATPLAIEHAPSTRESSIAKLAQQMACILVVPASIKRYSKTRPAGDTPRHSRRITGAKVELSSTDLERRSRKNTMKALGVINEHEGIFEQANEDYNKIFGKPLSDVDLEALAGLFNWSIPEFLEPV
jgi:hypothetical protein